MATNQLLQIAKQVRLILAKEGKKALTSAAPAPFLVKIQEEQKLDKAIQKLEAMDEDDFEVLRQKRLEKMKRQAQQKAEWQFHGHGV